VSQTWVRVGGGFAAFLATTVIAIVAFGGFSQAQDVIDPASGGHLTGANSFALILAVALVIGFLVYAGIEYAQTGHIDSISRQFDTRTIVLMPLAIAFNIILGQAVGAALKIPIYMDSIGTILVGALAGPLPGALTGLLSNLLWSYVVPPPLNSPTVGAFALVAAIIGLLAGTYARLGWFRPRPNTPTRELAIGGTIAIALVLVMAFLAWLGYTRIMGGASLTPSSDNGLFVVLGWLALLLVLGTVVGLILLLTVKRDLTAAYVVVMGVLTGLIAAAVSAPISANVFGGVTGAGTDFLVLAFRQAGSDIQAATLGQGFISDPIDKVTTFFVVYIILGAMAVRTKARFPQGELLIERTATAATA
jgi:hypothetical protein